MPNKNNMISKKDMVTGCLFCEVLIDKCHLTIGSALHGNNLDTWTRLCIVPPGTFGEVPLTSITRVICTNYGRDVGKMFALGDDQVRGNVESLTRNLNTIIQFRSISDYGTDIH